METSGCQKCQSEIRTDASKCPECGYEPEMLGETRRKIQILVGIILCLTVVGAIIGLPLLYYVYRQLLQAENRTPTNFDPQKEAFTD